MESKQHTDCEICKKQLLKVPEAAKILGVSRATAYEWVKQRKIPVVLFSDSKIVRVPRVELEKFIKKNTVIAS